MEHLKNFETKAQRRLPKSHSIRNIKQIRNKTDS